MEHWAQYWAHNSGDVYYVAGRGLTIREVCGPLDHTEVTQANLEARAFDGDPEDVDWMMEHSGEFCLVEPPYTGDSHKIEHSEER